MVAKLLRGGRKPWALRENRMSVKPLSGSLLKPTKNTYLQPWTRTWGAKSFVNDTRSLWSLGEGSANNCT